MVAPSQRRERVVGDQDPGQVGVDPEEDRDPVQVQRKGEDQAEDGVEPEQGGEAEEHAQGVGRSRPLGRVVGVEELLEPGSGFGNLTMDAAGRD